MLVSRPDFSFDYLPMADRGLPESQRTTFLFGLPDKDQQAWIKDNAVTQMTPAVALEIVTGLCRGWTNLLVQSTKPGGAEVELTYEEQPPTGPLLGSKKRQSAVKPELLARFGIGQMHELANAAVAGVPTRMTRDDAGN